MAAPCILGAQEEAVSSVAIMAATPPPEDGFTRLHENPTDSAHNLDDGFDDTLPCTLHTNVCLLLPCSTMNAPSVLSSLSLWTEGQRKKKGKIPPKHQLSYCLQPRTPAALGSGTTRPPSFEFGYHFIPVSFLFACARRSQCLVKCGR